jgi:hypothetical protein
MKALGMLRACREARQVIVERLPIRLRSRDSDQEIRLGLHDVLSVRNIKRFLADLHRAESYELEIPTAIFQIMAKGWPEKKIEPYGENREVIITIVSLQFYLVIMVHHGISSIICVMDVQLHRQ